MYEIIEFRIWKRWAEQEGRCQATTAKGQQCKNSCAGMGSDICNAEDFYRTEFVLGITDRCRVHGDPALITRLQTALAKEIKPALQ